MDTPISLQRCYNDEEMTKKIRVYYFSIDEAKKYQKEIVSCLNDLHRVDKANRYYFEKDRLLSLAGSYLIQKHTTPSSLFYTREGKPYKKGEFFSISHSGSLAIFAQDEASIGVDIEQIRSFPPSLVNAVLNDEEKRKWQTKDDFFKAWCLKESLSKAIGTGLKGDFKSIPAKEGEYFFKGNPYYSCIENRLKGYTIAVTSSLSMSFTIELIPDSFSE